MAMASKNKFLTYRGGMFLLLALLIISLICGFIIHHFSVVSSLAVSKHTDEGTFVLIICVAIVATIISLVLSVRLNRNIRNLNQIAQAMENGADIESMPEFAHDELGDISRKFIDLYRRLRHASDKAEREHHNAMHEQQEKLRIKRQQGAVFLGRICNRAGFSHVLLPVFPDFTLGDIIVLPGRLMISQQILYI